MDFEAIQFSPGDRVEAGIPERGAKCMQCDVPGQRLGCVQAADAATQVALEMQGYETGPDLQQFRRPLLRIDHQRGIEVGPV